MVKLIYKVEFYLFWIKHTNWIVFKSPCTDLAIYAQSSLAMKILIQFQWKSYQLVNFQKFLHRFGQLEWFKKQNLFNSFSSYVIYALGFSSNEPNTTCLHISFAGHIKNIINEKRNSSHVGTVLFNNSTTNFSVYNSTMSMRS